MTSAGRKIAVHTVENYLDALAESFIFCRAGRYGIKGKQYLKTGDKYYAADIDLRYCVAGCHQRPQSKISPDHGLWADGFPQWDPAVQCTGLAV